MLISVYNFEDHFAYLDSLGGDILQDIYKCRSRSWVCMCHRLGKAEISTKKFGSRLHCIQGGMSMLQVGRDPRGS